MAKGRDGIVEGQAQRLWAGGTVAGLAEGQVLGRFAADGDPAAFEALVERHGPMVLGVCRRYLRNPYDVEDAFQATFVILARKAGHLRERDALGPWLFGVARRVAARARAEAVRRGQRERPDAEALAVAPSPEQDGPDLGWLLDAEIARLPESLRLPVILCLVEGLTYEEAAGQLRWTAATVRGRLARARDRLRDRLGRRGVAPDGAGRKAPALPAGWAGVTAGVVTRSMARSGVVSSAVALADRTMRGWLMARLGMATVIVVAAGAALVGFSPAGPGRIEARPPDGPAPPPVQAAIAPATASTPAPARASARGRDGSQIHPITIEGMARDAEGRPVPGAAIFVTDANRSGSNDKVLGRTTSGPDGRFTLRDLPLPVLPPGPGPIPRPAEGRFEVAGTAPGLAFTWHAIQAYRPEPRPRDFKEDSRRGPAPVFAGEPIVADLTFGPPARIHGRVVDDRGRPVAGAKIQVGYVDDVRRPDGYGLWQLGPIDLDLGDDANFNGVASLPESLRMTRTDADGRYVIEGLPREMKMIALIDAGPAVESKTFTIATTRKEVSGVTSVGHDGTLDQTITMPHAIRVVLTLADSGQPATGATVLAQGRKMVRAGAMATSDAEGVATLSLPPGPYTLRVEPPVGLPYLVIEQSLAVLSFAPPLQVRHEPVEVAIPPGAVVELEAVDADTGAGLAGASFTSAPETSADRREVQSRPGFVDHPKTDDSGKLRAVMPPGRYQFYVSRGPRGTQPTAGDGAMLTLEPGRQASARFTFRKSSHVQSQQDQPETGEVGQRLRAIWEEQARKLRRGRMRATFSFQPSDGIAAEPFRALLESLDPDKVPALLDLIRERFPQAGPASLVTVDLVGDGDRSREEWVNTDGARRPPTNVTVYNGWETIRYALSNAQVDIGDDGPKSDLHMAAPRLTNYSHWPISAGKLASRSGSRVTLERGSGGSTQRVVADETTGFVYRDHDIHEPSGQGTDRWQFAPRALQGGAIVPGLSVEHRYQKDRTSSIWIRTIASAELDLPISPATFTVAVPPGTILLDYREGREDNYRGMVTRPVTDVVAYADADPRRFKPFVRPVKVGDPAPKLDPVAWLDRSGSIPAPTLAGKVVLVDFWGLDCGPCVAQLPEVREAVDHFAGTDLVVLGLHDSSGAPDKVAEFAKKREMTWPLAIDRDGDGFGAVFTAFGVRSIPGAVVIGRDGRIAFLGRFPEAIVRAAELLKGE